MKTETGVENKGQMLSNVNCSERNNELMGNPRKSPQIYDDGNSSVSVGTDVTFQNLSSNSERNCCKCHKCQVFASGDQKSVIPLLQDMLKRQGQPIFSPKLIEFATLCNVPRNLKRFHYIEKIPLLQFSLKREGQPILRRVLGKGLQRFGFKAQNNYSLFCINPEEDENQTSIIVDNSTQSNITVTDIVPYENKNRKSVFNLSFGLDIGMFENDNEMKAIDFNVSLATNNAPKRNAGCLKSKPNEKVHKLVVKMTKSAILRATANKKRFN